MQFLSAQSGFSLAPTLPAVLYDTPAGIMTSSFRENAALLLLPFYFYSALLVAGGSGPFILNRDFWICHCADAVNAAAESRSPTVNSLPALDTDDDLPVSADMEICRTKRTSPAPAEDSKMCKRKLPMRYLSVFFSNADIISVSAVFQASRPLWALSFLLPEIPASPRDAFTLSLLRPPAHVG